MFKCKEVLLKYNPNKLSTLCLISCYNNNIEINLPTIQFHSEPVDIIYKGFCLEKNCDNFNTHHHTTEIKKLNLNTEINPVINRFNSQYNFYYNSLVENIIPFNESSIYQIDEHKRRACKRRLDF